MDPFMVLFAIAWGVAFFVAGMFAGVIYARLMSNREADVDWDAWADARWKQAEALFEHLLEVTQGTASELGSHRERFETAVERLSEAVAEHAPAEAESSVADAIVERTQSLEQRLEQVVAMLEESHRHRPADAAGTAGAADLADASGTVRAAAASSDHAPPPNSETQVRERLEDASGDPKHLGRRQPRVAFEEMHEVAPVSAGTLPKREDFLSVHCRDISSAGFSFYFPGEVPWKTIVLRTCHNGTIREITADVVHCSRTAKPTAPAPYVVGCRFTGPLKRPAAKADGEQGAAKSAQSGAVMAF